MTIFAMLFGEQPRSLQADKVKGYKQRLSDAARVRFPAGPTLDDPLYARITWFHRIREGPDVDNLVKPILDSLQGVVFRNDSQIAQCVTTRIDLAKSYTISDKNIQDDLYHNLLDLISSGRNNHILYIEVGSMLSQQVVFGPVDGGEL